MLTLEDLATSVAAQIGATPEEVRDAFGTAVESHRYPAGEWLFHESTPRRWMGVVAEGDLELVRGLYGDTRIVGHLGVGATVGEGLLLGDDLHTVGARPATPIWSRSGWRRSAGCRCTARWTWWRRPRTQASS